ncbi:MAG: molybdopterin-dependent oxidoreductase [Pikeienuella sp.]
MTTTEKPRMPPGQGLIRNPDNWPVIGETEPRNDGSPWMINITGEVERPLAVPLTELMGFARTEIKIDIHCVTRWSKFDRRFSGIPLNDLLAEARPTADAKYIRFISRSPRAHDTSLPLDLATSLNALVTFEAEGEPLSSPHGGPVRMVTPGRYFYKSVKWLETIELRSDNKLGYWEAGPGYHNNADPWEEERFITGNISPELRQRMIDRRSFGKRDLLGVDFTGEDMTGLDASEATIRNAKFNGAKLRDASFQKAEYAGASFQGADMVGADMRGSDGAGADFRGADLRSVDFSDGRLVGVLFCDPDGGNGAIIDGATLFDDDALLGLTDVNRAYVEEMLKRGA